MIADVSSYFLSTLPKPEIMSATKYAELAMAYTNEAKLDSAKYYLSFGEKIMFSTLDSASIDECKYRIALAEDNYKNALRSHESENRIQNNVTNKVWQQAVVKSQRDYLNVKHEKVIAEKQSQKLRFLLVIIVLGVVVLYAIFYSIQAKLRNRLQLERLKNVLNERDYLENQVLTIRCLVLK